jgi:2-dehydro-3-deoxyphosphogluconate aldolase / (4S)-4-hydroxy-2-oxoglutarate aldolase
MSPIDAILAAAAPVMPVVTITDEADAAPMARALVAGGLRVIEVTLRTPAALAAISAISKVEGAIVGAGTVLSVEDYRAAVDAGSSFIVSPGATEELLDYGAGSDIPYLPAVTTPSEIMAGLQRGYSRFKFFPAQATGGIPVLSAWAAPFAGVRFCPTGGIRTATAPNYLALENVACVGGTWIAPADLMAAKAWDRIQALAAEAAALKPAR